jgi:hypothetical protein
VGYVLLYKSRGRRQFFRQKGAVEQIYSHRARRRRRRRKIDLAVRSLSFFCISKRRRYIPLSLFLSPYFLLPAVFLKGQLGAAAASSLDCLAICHCSHRRILFPGQGIPCNTVRVTHCCPSTSLAVTGRCICIVL